MDQADWFTQTGTKWRCCLPILHQSPPHPVGRKREKNTVISTTCEDAVITYDIKDILAKRSWNN